MLLGRKCLFLACELLECANDTESGVPRFNDIINVAHLGCLIRIAEEVVVLVLLLLGEFCPLFRVFDGLEFLAMKDLHCSVRSHHGDVR